MNTTIDLEPTWEALSRLVDDPRELAPACIIADHVRQAQKAGAKAVRFIFTDEGIDIEIEEVE